MSQCPAEMIRIAREHHQAGRLAEAEQLYRQVLAQQADDFDALHLLGVLSFQCGDPAAAVALASAALAQHPTHPMAAMAANNLGNFYCALADLPAAASAYRRALDLKPDLLPAQRALAQVYGDLQQFDAAIATYRQILANNPDLVDAHFSLAVLLQANGRLDEALQSYRQAQAGNANLPYLDFNLGVLLQDLGRFAEAECSYRRSLALMPAQIGAAYNLGVIYQAEGKLAQALACYDQVLAQEGGHADAHFNRGVLLQEAGQNQPAIEAYRQALAARPGFVAALFNLGNLFKDIDRDDEALACYAQAHALAPDDDKVLLNQGVVLRKQGRLAEAIACYRQAVACNPGYDGNWSNLLFSLAHDESVSPAAAFAEHLAFGRQFDRPLPALAPLPNEAMAPQRRLKVGLVSADLRQHPVSLYLEPLLQAIDPARIALYAYANQRESDATTQRLQTIMACWRQIHGLSDVAVVDLIKADGIDILIDLSGHTSGHRLPVFTYKPAPVQATWVGYFGTTGLAAIDYLLADPYLALPGVADALATEKIVRLPAVACFQAPLAAPPVGPLPALKNGRLTFGSFNRVSKLGDGVIARWSRVLRAIPDASLLLGAIPDVGAQTVLSRRFSAHGIAAERLQFHGHLAFHDYLALHQQVDILLDTYPFAGGATSNYALWMGVPVLTLAGDSLLSRQGAALLAHLGLPAFSAETEEAFLAQALLWQGRHEALAEIRAGLRERCRHSLIHQPQVVARAFEQAMQIMWQRRCAGLPAQAFSVGQ